VSRSSRASKAANPRVTDIDPAALPEHRLECCLNNVAIVLPIAERRLPRFAHRLLDDLVGARREHRRHINAKRLGCL
jgi:hypothetical protein